MFLSWIAWLAHHEKVANVVIRMGQAIAQAFAAITGGNLGSLLSNTVNKLGTPDNKLQPGKKVTVKKRDTGTPPKTDPATLAEPPSM